MARRPDGDGQQIELFGVPAPTPPTSPAPRRPTRRPRAAATGDDSVPAVPVEQSAADLAACLALPDLDELVAALPDDALAHLTLAAVRQLRRRLARSTGPKGGRAHGSALERAGQQLVAAFSNGDDDG